MGMPSLLLSSWLPLLLLLQLWEGLMGMPGLLPGLWHPNSNSNVRATLRISEHSLGFSKTFLKGKSLGRSDYSPFPLDNVFYVENL